MTTRSRGDEIEAGPRPRRIDWPSVAMTLVTLMALGWFGWYRFGPRPPAEPPSVGSVPPPLHLLDVETGEPLVLLGLKDKVVWVTFWSVAAPSGKSDLAALARVWNRLKPRRGFAMVAVAVGADPNDLLRATLTASPSRPPSYRATPETLRALGVNGQSLPMHLLIDATGHVGAVARGIGDGTLSRLSAKAEQWLDEMDPLGNTRFAQLGRPATNHGGRVAGVTSSLPRREGQRPGVTRTLPRPPRPQSD